MYSRNTELRHCQPTDVYRLGQILDLNGSWKKLMQIIPKTVVAEACDKNELTTEYKYNNDHIRLIESESIRQMRLGTEILFEEWGTSGKIRPTVGQLLDLLVKAELFRAADLVATSFLNEPPPERPSTGPAAKIDLSLPFDSEIFRDLKDILNNGFEPSTETLLENANLSSCEENKDFYTKYERNDKDLNGLVVPSQRIITQSHQQQQIEAGTQEIPRISQLLQPYEMLNSENNTHAITSASTEPNTALTDLSQDSVPRNSVPASGEETLPMISALNITSTEIENEPPTSFSRTSSESSNIDDDDDDDDIGLPEGLTDFEDEDISAPNRSLLEQRSSNNDSSLTNVTGTSGDNSFELSMHDRSLDASNDNIPHLTVLL